MASVDKKVQEQAAEAFSPKKVTEAAMPSVVTVLCGDSLGSGFVIDVDPPEGYRSAVVTNHHVIEGCTYTDRPEVMVAKGEDTQDASYTHGTSDRRRDQPRQLLWSKPPPNGAKFDLDTNLHHTSTLGQYWLASDNICTPTRAGFSRLTSSRPSARSRPRR